MRKSAFHSSCQSCDDCREELFYGRLYCNVQSGIEAYCTRLGRLVRGEVAGKERLQLGGFVRL